MVDYLEIYIAGVRKLGVGWVSDQDEFLEDLNDNLSDIKRFNYISLSLNMSKAYNYSLKQSSYEAMLIYLKGVRYCGNSNLTDIEMIRLEEEIRLYLSYVYGLTYQDIEFRSAKKYEYEQLEAI